MFLVNAKRKDHEVSNIDVLIQALASEDDWQLFLFENVSTAIDNNQSYLYEWRNDWHWVWTPIPYYG